MNSLCNKHAFSFWASVLYLPQRTDILHSRTIKFYDSQSSWLQDLLKNSATISPILKFSEEMYIWVFILLNTEMAQRGTSEAEVWKSLPGDPGRNTVCATVDGIFSSLWEGSACFHDKSAIFMLCISLYLPAFPKTEGITTYSLVIWRN